MIFYKTSSFGNVFIEIDENDLPARATDKSLLTREICDAQRAVGADGVVFYRARDDGYNFQIHNRDGSEAELSGNGMAGLAAVLFQRRLAASPLIIHAASGRRQVELLARRGPVFQLNVEIGRPDFSNRKFFPFLKDMRDCCVIDGLHFYPVSVGNPHAVVLCRERTAPKRLAVLGKKLESHPMFPGRVNVEFVYFSDAENPTAGTAALRPASCRVFFYERGVGPTPASSTGSAAVFAVLRRLGLIKDSLLIDCGADQIAVSWKQGIFINNFTRLICRGEYFQ
jgi:diaminopimelate epimerase